MLANGLSCFTMKYILLSLHIFTVDHLFSHWSVGQKKGKGIKDQKQMLIQLLRLLILNVVSIMSQGQLNRWSNKYSTENDLPKWNFTLRLHHICRHKEKSDQLHFIFFCLKAEVTFLHIFYTHQVKSKHIVQVPWSSSNKIASREPSNIENRIHTLMLCKKNLSGFLKCVEIICRAHLHQV